MKGRLNSAHFCLDTLTYLNSIFGFGRPIEPKVSYWTTELADTSDRQSPIRNDSEPVSIHSNVRSAGEAASIASIAESGL